jgi:hypothetical protein
MCVSHPITQGYGGSMTGELVTIDMHNCDLAPFGLHGALKELINHRRFDRLGEGLGVSARQR